MSFTGLWKLNQNKSSSQKSLLEAMNRPGWQISVIDGADEDFRLIHYTVDILNGNKVNLLDKKVCIYLQSTFLKALSLLTLGSIPFDQVNYNHKLVANGSLKNHKNDEKQFGDCSSKTIWSYKDGEIGSFTIRWYLQIGILKVSHSITLKDEFKMDLEFTNRKGVSVRTHKIYDRHPLSESDKEYVRQSKQFKSVNGFIA